MQLSSKFLLIPGIMILTLISCKKLVAISDPPTSLTTSQVFSNETEAAIALNSIYAYMTSPNTGAWADGGIDLYTGLSSDELVCYLGTADPVGYPFESNQLISNSATPDSQFWQPAYKVIYYANAILSGVAGSSRLSDSARNQLNGEAKFIRAFAYFYLTNLYGDIPLPLSTDFNQTALLARSSQTAVYAQIVSDLKDAQTLLPSNYAISEGDRIRPTSFAATAMLARVYLYQGDWTGADGEASMLIGNPLFALAPDPTGVFLKNSLEAIWQLEPNLVLPPYASNDVSHYVPAIIWSTMVVPSGETSFFLDSSNYAQYGNDLTPNYYLSPSMTAAFEPGDRRKVDWTSYTPTPGVTPWTGDTLWWPYKYHPGSANVEPANYNMLLRLAEQYLIRAEAKVKESNLAAATADINAIRNRAGLPNTTAISSDGLLTAIAQERRIELFAEWGDRWFDLKRTAKATSILSTLSYKQPFRGFQLLYPLSLYELTNDPNLTQNPGY